MNVNYPSSEIAILGVNEEGEESANDLAATGTDLPLLQDVDQNGDGNSDVWTDWDVVWRDVWVVDANNEETDVLNLTTNDLADQTNYDDLRQMIVDAATNGRAAASTWQNPAEPYDVNQDGFVVPSDVLGIIDYLNTEGSGELTGSASSTFVDVNGDNFATSLDALRVIRHLNRYSLVGEGEPEAEAEPPAVAADTVFALAAIEDTGNDED